MSEVVAWETITATNVDSPDGLSESVHKSISKSEIKRDRGRPRKNTAVIPNPETVGVQAPVQGSELAGISTAALLREIESAQPRSASTSPRKSTASPFRKSVSLQIDEPSSETVKSNTSDRDVLIRIYNSFFRTPEKIAAHCRKRMSLSET